MYRKCDVREFEDVIIMKRQRGRNRNNNRNNNNNHNRAMDSNGPEVKVRGTASTIYEKYTTLARDAQSSGNRVKAENLRQHAEHYLRVLNIQEAAKRAAQEERDAARAARGETDESESEDKKPRKQQSRRNNRDKTEAVKEEQNESSSEKALEVVTPDADNDSVTVEGDAEQPKRRRKAPARKSEEDSETVDAAE